MLNVLISIGHAHAYIYMTTGNDEAIRSTEFDGIDNDLPARSTAPDIDATPENASAKSTSPASSCALKAVSHTDAA